MKVALCLSGQIRDFALTQKSLHKFILSSLQPHEVSVFAHYPLEPLARLSFSALPFTRIMVEDESHVPLPAFMPVNHEIEDRPWHNKNSLRAYYLQPRGIYLADTLRKDFEKEQGIAFDWVFRLRYDNLYFGSCVENLADCDKGSVYIPAHDNWGGYNDRFAFGGSSVMDIYSTRFLHLAQYLLAGDSTMHPERMLKSYLDSRSVPIRRTRVSHHLLRYRRLCRAAYRPNYGDVNPPPGSKLSSLYSRLSRTRLQRIVDLLHMAKLVLIG